MKNENASLNLSVSDEVEVTGLSSIEQELKKAEEKYAAPKIPGIVNDKVTAQQVKAVVKDTDYNRMTRVRAIRSVSDIRALPKINKWYWTEQVGPKLQEGQTYAIPYAVAEAISAMGLIVIMD